MFFLSRVYIYSPAFLRGGVPIEGQALRLPKQINFSATPCQLPLAGPAERGDEILLAEIGIAQKNYPARGN
jgi:hypothetical protein